MMPAGNQAAAPGWSLRRVVDVRPDEVRPLLVAFAYFFVLLCSYTVLRPLRDAMGLVGGTGQLPWLFTATFLAMLAAVPVFGVIASRLPPRRFVPLVYRFFAGNVLLFGTLFATGWAEVAVARVFFVWTSVFNLFVVSVFWSVLVDRFDSAQGKRLFGFVAAGGTAGALAGPALTTWLAGPIGPAGLTVVSAILLEMAVRCARDLTRGGRKAGTDTAGLQDRGVGGGAFAGLVLLVRSRYLLGITVYMLLFTATSTFLYLEQARIVADRLTDTAARTAFFAAVDLAVGCLTLLLQLTVTAAALRGLGVAVVLAFLPLATAAAFGVLALWPTLALLTAMQAARRAIDFAFVRPGREILFTVVDREAKYKAKNAIETFIYRGGDAASGWISAGLVALGLGFGGIAAVSLPFVAGWAALALWLGREQERRAGMVSPASGRGERT